MTVYEDSGCFDPYSLTDCQALMGGLAGGISMAGHGHGRTIFATARERRAHLNDKYKTLRNLVPNPSEPDRASIVKDAVEYIKELVGKINELKILVEKKRCLGLAGLKVEDAGDDVEWLQSKSKDTEVAVRVIDDEVTIKLVLRTVRIIDDEVTIKIVQRKKINCLLIVSALLEELQLDPHHVAGGQIGWTYVFLFSTKIYEGSCVDASAIANKLIEVLLRKAKKLPQAPSVPDMA